MEPVVPKRKPNPKRLEKTLFVNHKEDQALEKRLESISLNSRLRMMELDRERISLKNEYRLSRRRKVPDVKPASPSHGNVFKMSRQSSTTLDPVNTYLLREYTKVGEVIPSILMSLSAKEEAKSQFVPPKQEPDVQAKTSDEPDLAKILHLVRNVKKMRHDMALSKRLERKSSNVNFSDLMKDFEEKEKASGDSESFTDGTCVLLRRKINKMRRESYPADNRHEPSDSYLHMKRHSVGVSRGSELHHQLPGLGPRSMTALGTRGRPRTDMTSYRMGQIAEEDDLITRTKVSRELENYDRIRGRIDNFMDGFEAYRLPPLNKSTDQST